MTNVTIVALPSQDDYINKISSEKVAHLTLLVLDDASKVKNLNEILDFAKFAADQTLMRFDLRVDHRGVLGPNLADVLFFSKAKWSGFEEINNYRSNLLKNDTIRTSYDSVEQFPEWIPHMTLGYPETPAMPDDRDYPGINYVSFDRIAVWDTEYDGVEFPLKVYDWDMAVAMGNITSKRFVENILTHTVSQYDPVKAHEYYIKNRQLKGRRPASSVISPGRPRGQNLPVTKSPTFAVKTATGKTVVLTQKQLAEQRAYAAKRVNDIKQRLADLGTKLKKLMAEANAKKNPTAADKSKAARQSRQYRQKHRQELKTKAKVARTTRSTHKDPVAELHNKINQVKGSLKAALEVQRSLATASKNSG